MPTPVKTFLSDEAGATAIEYALIAGLIFLVIVTAVGALGVEVGDLFGRTAEAFDG